MTTPRPEHAPTGDPCRCGLPRASHRQRSRARGDYFRAYRTSHPEGPRRIIAIDGEGYTTKRGRHRYTYMAACDEDGLVAELVRPKGVTFEDVATWLLDALPRGALLVGFSLGYDRTKWLESLDDPAVWALVHPEARQGKHGCRPVRVGGYRLNLVSSLFTVKREEDGAKQRVWDLFKFFQSSFVVALGKWQIGTERERESIARMKAKRGSFRGIDARERKYCQLECVLLAKLAQALIDAHEEEDLRLTSFYGPGSTASVLLKSVRADEQNADVPPEMREAVDSAYFGGRFECSRVGPVEGPIYAYDIASAYPYAFARLPCFAHGRWLRIPYLKLRPGTDRWAIIRYVIRPSRYACEAWGPLPHRLPDGNIVYPIRSAGGWAWTDEFHAGWHLHPGVDPIEAWVWCSRCNHPPPFESRVRELFERRLQWGKAARGIVLKLALNSMYGKSAQRVGSGRYRCMVRAGLVTSTTRAMLLHAVSLAKDPWNVLELATDSVLSTEPLNFPASPYGQLGSWEEKTKKDGPWPAAFLLRPGLRFNLAKTQEDMSHTAARGVGVRVLHENRQRVLRAWKRDPMATVTVQQPSIFHGARATIRRVLGEEDVTGDRGWSYVRDPTYGSWSTPTPRQLKYTPEPKRCMLLQGMRLAPWELPEGEAYVSVPYGRAPASPLGDVVAEMRKLSDEQPDFDLTDMF